jgi:hypothetical protein
LATNYQIIGSYLEQIGVKEESKKPEVQFQLVTWKVKSNKEVIAIQHCPFLESVVKAVVQLALTKLR